jgi:hypothetical protein
MFGATRVACGVDITPVPGPRIRVLLRLSARIETNRHTDDDTNAASIRVIERNGGSLRETKALETNRPLKRYYWITLS